MGFESFRVELRGGSVAHPKADRTIRELPHVKPDCESLSMQGSAYYLVDDGRHLIEVELRAAPVRVSCRFTLCHPSSVDSVFLELVRELMLRLSMEAKICDDVRPEHSHWFSLDHYDEFSSVTSHYIAARRVEWRAAFGTEQLAATTNEIYERIILPRCQPVVEHPA
jgi:hypothetical protein